MMGLLVQNFPKFIIFSMSIVICIFGFITYLISYAFSLFFKACVKRINTICKGLEKKNYCVKICLKIFGNCDRMIPMILFSDSVALFRIIISEHPQSGFYQIAKYLYRSNVILYCLDDYC